jgi:LacI family transcriptional regulator
MAELGLTFATYQSPPPFKQATTVDIEQANVLFESALANWLRALAKPVGIVAANDIRGQQLLATCRTIDMLVPEQIAVVGIDNDLTLCELSDPPMSSVELDAHQIGLQAAEILDEMMSGREYSGKSASIPPKGVIKRQSTDAIVVEDPQVAIALRYIRLHASMGLSVEDVASQVPLSRRTLERRIRESLDCSINELIIRHQLEQAKKLLAETDWSLMVIASRSGFRHGEYLSTLFKREMGITPGEYRRKIKDKQAAPPDDGN